MLVYPSGFLDEPEGVFVLDAQLATDGTLSLYDL